MAFLGPQEQSLIPRPLTFTVLPAEVKKEIFSHCSQADLICLSLVSKHFHELAAAQLYRNFHIIFPDEDDSTSDYPIDGLAAGLDTFVTSEYNYAQHLRGLSLDTISAGRKAETAYRAYLANLSCGKFMNTLLLLTLRKAENLETFRWNIRVELSRPVFKELHNIKTLAHLHMRLQEGPSIYEIPPPLPLHAPPTIAYTSPNPHPGSSMAPLPLMQQFSPLPPLNQPTQGFYMPPNPPPAVALAPKPPKPRVTTYKKSPGFEEPPTFSGFNGLKTLSILDIDSLDVITELKSCLRNSSATLSKLKLSFSERLASQARSPSEEIDPEDSDVDDDFQAAPQPMPSLSNEANNSRVARAQEEKKVQEAVLARIFDVEPYQVSPVPQEKRQDPKQVLNTNAKAQFQASVEFFESVKAISNKLVLAMGLSSDFGFYKSVVTAVSREAEAFRQKAMENAEAEASKEIQEQSDSASSAASSSRVPQLSEAEPSRLKNKDVMAPEDIDVEAPPEEELSLEAPDSVDNDTPNENTPEKAILAEAPNPVANSSSSIDGSTSHEYNTTMANLAAQKVNFDILAEKAEAYGWQANELQKDIQHIAARSAPVTENAIDEVERKLADVMHKVSELNREFNTVDAEIQSEAKRISDTASKLEPRGEAADTVEAQKELMSEYQRSTRGIQLKSLSIYLIPAKASVLSKAIDLRMLTKLTLLNVGIQAPIWSHLSALNREAPLPLRWIHTDNVTSVFLSFVHELDEVHDLFMLERNENYKPERFAPKTTMTIEHMRKMVLKKHLPFLRRLMIKNFNDDTWDLNERTIYLMDKGAKRLTELSCSISIRALRIGGFVALQALHIFQLRNEDTCVWVLRETKRFLIDNLSHYPKLKLEWVSIDDDDRVEKIVRILKKKKRGSNKKSKKGKGTESAVFSGSAGTDFAPSSWSSSVAANEGAWEAMSMGSGSGSYISDSEEESEDDDGEAEMKVSRIETVSDYHFFDVPHVRIFKKEMVLGIL
ncbi:hypothetical protein QBC38DRAFT_419402 [Podospora fimiseda]|uniref:F-box domain-containing protein n=1 Tax=Podospora fimiseda TaxID=252190 RepID=A0AAN7BN19_9PEZI|nr:hypothetical protein QBC38DRAFT_419402 [Podospora fimiseda]